MQRRTLLIVIGLVLVAGSGIVLATQLTAASYASVQDALRAHGASVQENGLGSQPFLTVTDHRLTVNGSGIDVFEYRTTLGPSLDAGRISRDGSTFGKTFGPFGDQAATVNYIAPPHWFHTGRVVVLYVGQDPSILRLLQMVIGKQFAGGGNIPTAGSATGDYPSVLARLHAGGATIIEASARASRGLAPDDTVSAIAHEVSVNGQIVTMYVLRDAQTARTYAARIRGGDLVPANGQGVITIDYRAPPHFYRVGSVVVVYVGQDAHMLRVLSAVLGMPFDHEACLIGSSLMDSSSFLPVTDHGTTRTQLEATSGFGSLQTCLRSSPRLGTSGYRRWPVRARSAA
jgi:hypothetical protein